MFQGKMAQIVSANQGVEPSQIHVIECQPCEGLFDVMATWVVNGREHVATAAFMMGLETPIGEISVV